MLKNIENFTEKAFGRCGFDNGQPLIPVLSPTLASFEADNEGGTAVVEIPGPGLTEIPTEFPTGIPLPGLTKFDD